MAENKGTNQFPPTGDASVEALMRRMDAMEKRQTEKEKEADDKLAQVKKEYDEKLAEMNDELNAFKNFETMYANEGNDIYFYMDVERFREIMFENTGDDKEKNENFEAWYKKKQSQSKKRIGGALAAGGAVGGAAGLLACTVHAPAVLAVGGAACLTSCGIVALGVVGGVVLAALGLGAYKLFRKYKAGDFDSFFEWFKGLFRRHEVEVCLS